MKALTPEQQQILDARGDLKINAVAGSGKTTTLVALAGNLPPSDKVLYLAFNRTVRDEAKQRFQAAGLDRVRVETAHSLAYRSVVRQRTLQLTNSYKPFELARQLQIKSKDADIRYLLASHTLKYLQIFLNSEEPDHKAINYAGCLTDPKAKGFADRFAGDLVSYTGRLLELIESGQIPCLHDYYLKKYQLTKPKLSYDHVLFDEGQDASGVMLEVLLAQKARKVIVGDVHQQIYAWRQAVNSLQKVPFPTYQLSTSFRFGEEIAEVARRVLAWKQQLPEPGMLTELRGCGGNGQPAGPKAILARSNLFLLDKAIQCLHSDEAGKWWFEGNITAYTFAADGTSIFDVLALQQDRVDKVRDPLLKSLGSFSKLEEYLEKAEDPELAMITEMVRKYGDELPAFINQLKNRQVEPENRLQAGLIFSTVHRSKGLEYDSVELTEDFLTHEKFLKTISDAETHKVARLTEEINLLYVAMTRAKNRLWLPAGLWPQGAVMPVIPPAQEAHFRRKRPQPYLRADKHAWEWGQGFASRVSDTEVSHLYQLLVDEQHEWLAATDDSGAGGDSPDEEDG